MKLFFRVVIFQKSKLLICFTTSLVCASLFAPFVLAESTRATYPDAFSLELLGRGIYYTINYDKVLDDRLVAGLGFGSSSVESVVGSFTSTETAYLVPAYVNYYFTKDQSAFFMTGGLTVNLNAGSVRSMTTPGLGLTFGSLPFIPNAGVGYENRSDQGFLFRATTYGMIGNNLSPSNSRLWFGVTLGQAF